MNLNEMAKKYGTVCHDDVTITLTDYAVFDGLPNNYYPRYVAPGMDDNGAEYRVYFRVREDYVTEEYDGSNWTFQLSDDAPEDGSELCDWDTPDEVVRTEEEREEEEQ